MKSWHLICIYYASRQMVKVFFAMILLPGILDTFWSLLAIYFLYCKQSPLFIKKMIIIKEMVRSFNVL